MFTQRQKWRTNQTLFEQRKIKFIYRDSVMITFRTNCKTKTEIELSKCKKKKRFTFKYAE